ncbi:hypothetical protein ACNO6Y_07095 [Vibrio owensii]|uniref:hypothetical protein n=1 Tax=Vibrio owensii TaxID=696485 RepID=UPI003AACDE9D
MPKRSLDLVVMPMMLISEIGITIALTLMISPPNHSGLVINPPENGGEEYHELPVVASRSF